MEARRVEVSRLSLRGYDMTTIARKLGVSVPTISTDLDAIEEQLRAAQVEDMSVGLQRKLRQYDEIRLLAMEAYERSQEDAETLVVKTEKALARMKKGDPKANEDIREEVRAAKERFVKVGEEVTKTSKDQVGSPAFLNIAKACLDEECKLLGLTNVEEIHLHDEKNITIVNWEGLHEARKSEDYVERRLSHIPPPPTRDTEVIHVQPVKLAEPIIALSVVNREQVPQSLGEGPSPTPDDVDEIVKRYTSSPTGNGNGQH